MMIFYHKSFGNARFVINQVRFLASKTVGTSNTFEFENSFSTEQQSKVVETLNESGIEKLSGFNIPVTHIKNIEVWKSKNGRFTSIHEVLNVDGIGSKILDRICNNIVNNVNPSSQIKPGSSSLVTNKRNKHLVMPVLTDTTSGSVQVMVAIHISLTGISWARISRNKNTVTSWSYQDFSSLPKKMTPIDTFNVAIRTLKKIPPGDIYIFEQQESNGGPQNVKQSTIYTQQNELASMLIALLNTSAYHNPTLRDLNSEITVKSIENRIYFFKARLAARIFRTLVGNERVSAVNIVSRLVKDEKVNVSCTPIVTGQQIQSFFFNQSAADKELLCQALMLAMSFMDLCIYKNPVSFEALRPRRNN